MPHHGDGKFLICHEVSFICISWFGETSNQNQLQSNGLASSFLGQHAESLRSKQQHFTCQPQATILPQASILQPYFTKKFLDNLEICPDRSINKNAKVRHHCSS
ncbi:hypothetical protein SLE2022_402360 [Rubroshorea leprosula]